MTWLDPLKPELQSCELPRGCWGSNVLLRAEASLLSPHLFPHTSAVQVCLGEFIDGRGGGLLHTALSPQHSPGSLGSRNLLRVCLREAIQNASNTTPVRRVFSSQRQEMAG